MWAVRGLRRKIGGAHGAHYLSSPPQEVPAAGPLLPPLQCPIHVEGTLGTEEVRRGLNLTSWEAAQNLIAEWNRAGKVGGDRVEPVSVKEAVELYLADVAARRCSNARG
jgi:hypothetical protein